MTKINQALVLAIADDPVKEQWETDDLIQALQSLHRMEEIIGEELRSRTHDHTTTKPMMVPDANILHVSAYEYRGCCVVFFGNTGLNLIFGKAHPADVSGNRAFLRSTMDFLEALRWVDQHVRDTTALQELFA